VAIPLVLLGAGDHAREIVDIAAACRAAGRGDCEVAGFLVDASYGSGGTAIDGVPILGDFNWLADRAHAVEVVCAVGAPALRLRLSDIARSYGVRFATLVHPSVALPASVVLGEGVVVAAGVIMTQRIAIGDHTHVNIGCTLSHGVVLADHVTLSPGVHLAGGVVVERGTFVGIGACAIERTRLGSWSTVGAGATVVRDVARNATVVGVPAREIEVKPPGWHHTASLPPAGHSDSAAGG
jgi:sugar O-acyltransferase (sialic acid O-acetyltransferase NeuD family)